MWLDYRFTQYSLQSWGDLNMWVDYRGSLNKDHNIMDMIALWLRELKIAWEVKT